MSDPFQEINAYKDQISKLLLRIDQAIDQAAKGNAMDISAIEKQVDMLCANIRTMQPNTAVQIQPDIAEMIARLDELESLLNTIKE